jgi:integrase
MLRGSPSSGRVVSCRWFEASCDEQIWAVEFYAPPRHPARHLLGVARSDRLFALFSISLSLGLRRGEALGLPWSDVDIQQGVTGEADRATFRW